MAKKTGKKVSKYNTILWAAAALLLITLFFLLNFFDMESQPSVFVTNKTTALDDGLLFRRLLIRYPASGNVTDMPENATTLKIGVVSDTDSLRFGYLIQNMSEMKVVNMTNNAAVPAKVRVLVYGNISKLIIIDPKEIMLQPGEKTNVNVIFNATELGCYEGEIDVKIKIPKFDILLPLMIFS